MAREGPSPAPWILIGLGAVLAVVAVIGLIADLGAETTTSTPAVDDQAAATTSTTASPGSTSGSTTSEPTSSSATTETTATTTATTVAAETPDEFLDQLADAFRSGDIEFKLARLHPAVIERFGEDACRAYFESLPADPTAAFVVIAVSGPDDYEWTLDGETRVVPETLAVDVTRTANGAAQAATIHLTAVDGQLRWYTDCTPDA